MVLGEDATDLLPDALGMGIQVHARMRGAVRTDPKVVVLICGTLNREMRSRIDHTLDAVRYGGAQLVVTAQRIDVKGSLLVSPFDRAVDDRVEPLERRHHLIQGGNVDE